MPSSEADFTRRRACAGALAAALATALTGCASAPRALPTAPGPADDALLSQPKAELDACRPCGQGGAETSALGCAAFAKRLDLVTRLLAKGADPTAVCTFTPLMAASWAGDASIMKALLDAKANPAFWTRDQNWNTALEDQVWGVAPSTECVRLLVEAGAEVDHRDFLGITPLWMAAGKGQTAVVEYLLSVGADPSIMEPINKQSAADIADKDGHADTAKVLREFATPEGRRLVLARVAAASCAPKLRAAEKAGDGAARKGDTRAAMAYFGKALEACPDGDPDRDRVLTKVFDAARLAASPPAIPKEAQHHADRGTAFVKLARDSEGFAKAAREFAKAAAAAPWWAEAYFNEGLAQEKAGDPRSAAASLKRFLLASPDAPEAAAVKQKLVELEVTQELAPGAGDEPASSAQPPSPVPAPQPAPMKL